MEELFKRLLDLLPAPLLLALIAVGAVAWVVKQLKPGSEYGDILRDKIFQRAAIFIIAVSIATVGIRSAWMRLRAADFRPGENGICVARFQDDNGQVLQRYTVEQLRAIISQDPLLASVRVEPYPVTVTSVSEARSLASQHHAIATIWGSGISGFGANIVSFEVTPSQSAREIRKLCPKFPDIDDFTQGMVTFVKTSISQVAASSSGTPTASTEQHQIRQLEAANLGLSAKLNELESRRSGGPEIPAASSEKAQRHRFGIFIGINDYSRFGASQRFSVSDAQAVAAAFRNASSIPANVTLLTDSQATRYNILSTMDRVAKQVAPNDQVWLYFSGVGYRNEPTGSSYLALADTTRENMTASSLSSEELLGWIKGLKSKQVLVLLDACHTGLEIHRGIAPIRQRDDDTPGRVFLAAAGPDGLAYEEASLGHGAFTYYLLGGLSGQADITRSGYLTPEDLFFYIQERVVGNSASHQNPVFEVIDGTGDFTVADLRGPKSNNPPVPVR
jgi:hypothetical protein